MRCAAACFAVALATGACKGDAKKPAKAPPAEDAAAAVADARPERIVVTDLAIKVVDPSRGPEREVFPRLVAQSMGRELAGSGQFTMDPEPVPEGTRGRKARLEVVIGYDLLQEGTAGGPAALAVVEAGFVWEDGRPGLVPSMNAIAERPLSEADQANLDGVIAEHVERTAVDAARGLAFKEELRAGGDDAAIAGLASEDEGTRVWALRLVADRAIAGAYEAVAERFVEATSDVERDAAIGALVALRDPRGVEVLTEHTDMNDYDRVRRVLDPIAAIGGEEAVTYLEFIASGHPDAQIRAQAIEGLDRMKRRQARREAP